MGYNYFLVKWFIYRCYLSLLKFIDFILRFIKVVSFLCYKVVIKKLWLGNYYNIKIVLKGYSNEKFENYFCR